MREAVLQADAKVLVYLLLCSGHQMLQRRCSRRKDVSFGLISGESFRRLFEPRWSKPESMEKIVRKDLVCLLHLHKDRSLKLSIGEVLRYLAWHSMGITPVYAICPTCKNGYF